MDRGRQQLFEETGDDRHMLDGIRIPPDYLAPKTARQRAAEAALAAADRPAPARAA